MLNAYATDKQQHTICITVKIFYNRIYFTLKVKPYAPQLKQKTFQNQILNGLHTFLYSYIYFPALSFCITVDFFVFLMVCFKFLQFSSAQN